MLTNLLDKASVSNNLAIIKINSKGAIYDRIGGFLSIDALRLRDLRPRAREGSATHTLRLLSRASILTFALALRCRRRVESRLLVL